MSQMIGELAVTELLHRCRQMDELLPKNLGTTYRSRGIDIATCHLRCEDSDLDSRGYAISERKFEFRIPGVLSPNGSSWRGDLEHFLRGWSERRGWRCERGGVRHEVLHSGRYLNPTHLLWGLWREVLGPVSGFEESDVEVHYSEVFPLKVVGSPGRMRSDVLVGVSDVELTRVADSIFTYHSPGWLEIFALTYRAQQGRWFGKDDRGWFKNSEVAADLLTPVVTQLGEVGRELFLGLAFDNLYPDRSFFDAGSLLAGMLL